MSEIVCKRCGGSGDGDPASDRPYCPECEGRGSIPTCAIEGCNRAGEQDCEMCGSTVCMPHSRVNGAAQMILCFSCDIGISEGMPDEMKGMW